MTAFVGVPTISGTPNPDLLVHPDPPDPHIAVCTFWTDPEQVRIRYPNAAVVGPLRSLAGLDELIRNLLANPQIRVLIFDGEDILPGQPVLKAVRRLWCSNIREDELLAVVGSYVAIPGLADLPPCTCGAAYDHTALGHVLLVDRYVGVLTTVVPDLDPDFLDHTIVTYKTYTEFRQPRPGGRHVLLPSRPEPAKARAPHGDPGDRIAGDTLSAVHPRVLQRILLSGTLVTDQKGVRSYELLCLVSVIREPSRVAEANEANTNAVAYYHRLIKPFTPQGVSYTYGSRISGQLEKIEALLAANSPTRSAFVTPWDGVQDSGLDGGRPCLTGLWFRVVDGALHAVAAFRSHDMTKGYPDNVIGISFLLRDMASRLGLLCGTLTVASWSAHIYEADVVKARVLVDSYKQKGLRFDQRSNWTVQAAEQDGVAGILATAMSPEGSVITTFFGRTPKQLLNKISESGLVQEIGNALWLGSQIERVYREKV